MPYRFLALLLVAFLSGCTLFQPMAKNQAGRIAADELAERADAEVAAQVSRNQAVREDMSGPIAAAPPREGTGVIGEIDVGKSIEEARKKGVAAKGKGARVRLDFADASLKDIIVVFLQDYLKQPYTFQDSFKDRKVNLFFDAMATREELIQLFDTLLDNYGVRLRYSGGVHLIGMGDAKDAKEGGAHQRSPLGVGDAVGVFRPRFIDGKDLLALAKSAVRYGDRISVLPGNVVVVNSTSADMRAVAALMQDVDLPAFANKQIIVYAPRYLSGASLAAILDSYQAQVAGAQPGAKQFEAKQIPETERVIIVAANAIARDLVVQFLAQTDIAGANQRRVFQYALGTQVAADLATNLGTLLKSVFKSPTELSVVPDKTSNSLFIYATPDEYAEIRKLLDRMDYRPPAVHIDIVIAEVKLTGNMTYGVEWYLKSTGKYLTDLTTLLGVDRLATTGMALGIINTGNDNYATLQLLGSETSFSLLTSPKIVVKNGATAKIAVGQEQPVIKQKTTNNAAAGNNTIVEPEFKKIGLELEVTPFVAQNNQIRLLIKLKETTIVGYEVLASDKYPVLANREISTDLVTGDGKTVFLGGIRKQDTSDVMQKIPGLGDLTWLGVPFRNKTMNDNGQELIILATPTLILDQQGADVLTRAVVRAAKREFTDPRPDPASQQSADGKS
jgi:general secretion pathway protein D